MNGHQQAGGPPPGGGHPPAWPVPGQHPYAGQPQYPVPGQHPYAGQPQYPVPGQHPYAGQPQYPVQPYPGQPPTSHLPHAGGYGAPPAPAAGHQPYPVGHPPYGHAGPFVRAQYEFDERENKILGDLASWSGGLGIVKLIHGALSLVVGNVFGFLLHLAVGLLMLNANRSLRKVVTTKGNDIDHLLKSVEHLATVFQIRLILTLMVTILVAVVAAVASSS